MPSSDLLVLGDDDVRRWLPPGPAVTAARSALAAAYRGDLAAPPRLHADIGGISLAFTAGGFPAGPLGFRVYGTWPGQSDQAVLVWDGNGRLAAVIAGAELGTRRTGALGGVAADLLAPAGPVTGAVIGSGAQAWAQLWACASVRQFREVRVYSPSPGHAAAFADRARARLGLPAAAVASARAAVDGAGVVLVATRSPEPVLAAAWIAPGAHVSTVGPKTASRHELPPELASQASLVVSDSPQQAAAYGEPFFTGRPLTHLGAIVAGERPGRGGPDEITLYCSTGLAGSEVVMAGALLSERARAGGAASPDGRE
jgi:ornithine cyclodeaminase/alanine dehydrogenase-like protein (mu-crystallin family)